MEGLGLSSLMYLFVRGEENRRQKEREGFLGGGKKGRRGQNNEQKPERSREGDECLHRLSLATPPTCRQMRIRFHDFFFCCFFVTSTFAYCMYCQ